MKTEYRVCNKPNKNGRYEVRAVSVTDRGDVSRTVIAERSTYEQALQLVKSLSK